MKIHVLITFAASAMFHKSRATTFDLHSASSFLLDMFDIGTPMTNNLSTEIEPWDRLEIDRDPLLWPFPLHMKLVSLTIFVNRNYALYQTRPFQLVQAHAYGIVAHQLNLVVPVS